MASDDHVADQLAASLAREGEAQRVIEELQERLKDEGGRMLKVVQGAHELKGCIDTLSSEKVSLLARLEFEQDARSRSIDEVRGLKVAVTASTDGGASTDSGQGPPLSSSANLASDSDVNLLKYTMSLIDKGQGLVQEQKRLEDKVKQLQTTSSGDKSRVARLESQVDTQSHSVESGLANVSAVVRIAGQTDQLLSMASALACDELAPHFDTVQSKSQEAVRCIDKANQNRSSASALFKASVENSISIIASLKKKLLSANEKVNENESCIALLRSNLEASQDNEAHVSQTLDATVEREKSLRVSFDTVQVDAASLQASLLTSEQRAYQLDVALKATEGKNVGLCGDLERAIDAQTVVVNEKDCLTHRLDDLQARLDREVHCSRSLESKLAVVTRTSKEAEDAASSLTGELLKQSDANAHLSQTLEDTRRDYQAAVISRDAACRNSAQLQKDFEVVNAHLTGSQRECTEKIAAVAEQVEINSALRLANKGLQVSVAEVESSLNTVQSFKQRADDERDSLRSDLSGYRDELERERSLLQHERIACASSKEQFMRSETRIVEVEDQLSTMEARIKREAGRHTEQMEALRKEFDDSEHVRSKLERSIQETRDRLTIREKELARLECARLEATQATTLLEGQIRAAQEHIATTNEEKSEMRQRLDNTTQEQESSRVAAIEDRSSLRHVTEQLVLSRVEHDDTRDKLVKAENENARLLHALNNAAKVRADMAHLISGTSPVVHEQAENPLAEEVQRLKAQIKGLAKNKNHSKLLGEAGATRHKLQVPQHYTLQGAVEAALPYDMIEVSGGIIKLDQPVHISKPIHLTGSGDCTISPSGDFPCLILLDGCGHSIVNGIHFTNEAAQRQNSAAALIVVQSQSVEPNSSPGCSSPRTAASNNNSPVFTQCVFTSSVDDPDSTAVLVEGKGGVPCFEHNSFLSSLCFGLTIRNGGQALVTKNLFDKCSGSIKCSGSSSIIQANTIRGSSKEGIVTSGSCCPVVVENEISESEGSGLKIEQNSHPVVLRNTIQKGKQDGIWLRENAGGVVCGNDVTENRMANILITTGAQPTVTDNNLTRGGFAGLWAYDGGNGWVTNNRMEDNAWSGVLVQTEAAPTVISNIVRGNGRNGLEILDGGGGLYCSNSLVANASAPLQISGDPLPEDKLRLVCNIESPM